MSSQLWKGCIFVYHTDLLIFLEPLSLWKIAQNCLPEITDLEKTTFDVFSTCINEVKDDNIHKHSQQQIL